MIRSAVAGNIELQQQNVVLRQIIFAVLGFVVVLGVAAIDYHLWSSVSRSMYLTTAILLAILYVIGSTLFGSARWFSAGSILIQPSEIAKIVLILVLADYFTRNQEKLGDIRFILRSLALTLGIVIWVLLQPNLSTSIVMMVLWFALLWAAGLPVKYLVLFGVFGITTLAVAFPVLIEIKVIQQYQLDRIINFIFPNTNASYGDIYNIQQALISIGSGGWFGKGYGHGTQTQLRFLKVRHSDYIFAAMAEEFGFIGTVLVILVLVFVIWRILRAARLSRDTFGGLICYGVATLITFQAFVNIGVNLNLLPATGLTLPLVSYGGSSLLSVLLGIGLVESVILRHKSLEF